MVADDGDMSMNGWASVKLAAGVLLTACLAAEVAGQAPVNRRLSVRRSAEGFSLLGFRAAPSRENRFELRPGMTAAEVRAQLESVSWDEFDDGLSLDAAQAVAGRRRPGDTWERLLVELDRPDGQVRQAAYQISPVSYSRANLLRFLRAGFGPATVMAEDADHVNHRYVGANPDYGLIVDARRIGPEKAKWRLRYQLLDLRAPPGEAETPAFKEVGALIPIWPLADRVDGAVSTTQPARGAINVPADVGKGLKQIYPPPETQATD